MPEKPAIISGGVLVYRLFDVAWEIDLAAVEATLTESRRFRIDRKLFSKAFEFKNPPVSIALHGFEMDIGGAPRQASFSISTWRTPQWRRWSPWPSNSGMPIRLPNGHGRSVFR
jgi:hypothetical protein